MSSRKHVPPGTWAGKAALPAFGWMVYRRLRSGHWEAIHGTQARTRSKAIDLYNADVDKIWVPEYAARMRYFSEQRRGKVLALQVRIETY